MLIGNVEIKGKVVLGPMAGVTDMPFRSLCSEHGAAMTYTEMVSAKALYYKNKNTKPLLETAPNERHVAVQLFGNEPELLADEAAKLSDGPYDMFDINMGCPVPKVVNNGEGSHLMLEPERAESIVKCMTERLKKPVTVKIRKGFDSHHVNAVDFAKRLEQAGVAAIAIHGRTRDEYYGGTADWDIIRQVKEAVGVPVIGSGDIFTGADVVRMLDATGCDAVMAARGARGNPWIFEEAEACIKAYEEGITPAELSRPEARTEIYRRPDIPAIKEMIKKHLMLMIDFAGEESAVRQMRKHAAWYSAGLTGGAVFRREINNCQTLEEFLKTLTLWGL